MKLVIYCCDEHDHSVGELNGETVWQTDYDYELVLRVAEHLKWEVETITLSYEEFSARFS